MASLVQGRVAQRARPFFLLVALLPAAQLAAQTPATLEETVVRATRLPADSSVTQQRTLPEQCTDSMPLLPSDLLRATPGAFVQQTTPGQGIPIVRGLKGSQVLHLVDGFRLNNAFFRSSPNQYLALVPTAAVGSIDVARGPVGTAYGSDAMGGVVQLNSVRPAFDRALDFGGRLGWVSSSEGVTGVLAPFFRIT